jgi:PAS domain S-box-containing protein
MDEQTPHILIVDDDPNMTGTISDILIAKGYQPTSALSGAKALTQVEEHQLQVALIDLRLGDMSGMDVLRGIKARSPRTECILLTGHATQNSAIDAVQAGAFGYFQKPFDLEQVLLSIQRAVEKYAAETRLHESEERYRGLFEDSPIALREEDFSEVRKHLDLLRQQGVTDFQNYFVSHPELVLELAAKIKIVEVNKAALKMYRADNKDKLPSNLIEALDGESADRFRNQLIGIAEGRLEFYWEGMDRTIDGKQIYVEVNWSVAAGYEKDLSKVIVSIQDITERKHAADLVREQGEQLRLLYEASQQLNRTLDLKEIYQAVCDFMSTIAVNDGLFISAFDPETQLITCRAYWMENKWLDVSPFPAIPLEEEGKGTQSLVIRSGQPMLINDYQALVETVQSGYYINSETNQIVNNIPPEEDITRSALIVPLKLKGRVSGVIQVMSYRLNDYNENQLKLLEALALHVASAEQNAQLYSQVQAELNERKLVEKSLRENEEQYRTLVEQIPAIVFIDEAREDGSTIYVSPQIETLLGFTPQQWLEGSPGLWAKQVHPIDLEWIHARYLHCRQSGEPYDVEYRIRASDGRLLWFHDQAIVLRDENGNPNLIHGLMYDITERKQAEEKLRASEERYRELFTSMIDGFALHAIICDENGKPVDYRFLEINPAFERLTGLKSENLIGKTVFEVLPNSESYWTEIYGNVALTGRSTFFENYSRELDRYFEVSAYCPQPGQFAVIMVDITERKRAEEVTHQRVLELELLYEGGLAFSQLLNPKDIGQKIISLLEQKMNWHHTAIRLYDSQTKILHLLAFSQPSLDVIESLAVEEKLKEKVTRPDQGVSGWAVEHCQIVRSTDLPNDARYFETLPGMQSGLYVPIKLGDHVIGVISIESENPNAFSQADERLTDTLASQAASALENARLFDETRLRIKELTTLHSTSQSLLAARLDTEEIYTAVHQAVAKTMKCDAFVIVLDNEDWDEYHAVYFFDKGTTFSPRRLPRGTGLSGRVISSGETLMIDDTSKENVQATHFGSMESTLSILAVPLRRGNETIGMLSTQSYQPHAYNDSQRALLETIGAQLSSALDNTNLFQQTQARIRELESLYIITTSLRSIQSIEGALSTLLDNTLATLDTSAGEILLYNQDSNELRGVVAKGWFKELMDFPVKSGTGVAGTVFATGEPYNSIEFAHDVLPQASSREMIPLGWGGICLPIRISTEIIGVMFISIQQPRQINSQQVRLLESLVEIAGVTINRIRLYDAAARRAEEFASLYETSKVLSAEYDLDTLLEVIVEHAREILNSSTSGMYLYDAKRQVLELKMDNSPERPVGMLLQIGEGLAGKVAQTRQPMRIEDYSIWEGRSPHYEGIPIRAVIEVPMLFAGELIGVLAADEDGNSNRKFTESDERLLSLFASQAAGAINAARRREETIHYADELEERVIERTAEIESTRKRLDLAARAGGIGVWEIEIKENKVILDKRMHFILGTDPEEFDNTLEAWWARIYPEDLEQTQKHFAEALKKTGIFSDEHRIIRLDGSLRYTSVNGIVLSDSEYNPERMIGVAVDITDRKQAEEALKHASFEMERAMRTKDEFLANMSHELRTPLNAILGISESLEEQFVGALNDKQLKYTGIIRESGRHLLDLINDILDISKIDAGRLELDLHDHSVEKICQSSLRMIRELAQKKDLSVSFEIKGGVKTILVDDRRLKQSLVNLLGNAVKFTPQGGTIGLEVNGHPELSEVTFTIWDTGVGIASEDIQYLFKPFVQLDAGLAREFQGTGLGLALVAQMIHLHGGRVHVESTLGQGSRFIITLPWWSEQQNAPLTRATGEIPRVRLKDGRKLSGKILLVEDTNVVITLMSEYLIYKGYKVYIAGNGLEGVQIAKEEHPDLILMDVMMPVMDGLEATRRIRADQSLRDVPIIALTALAMADDREHCLAAGMNDYMSKPIKMQELSDVIEKYLGAGSVSGGKKSSVDNESHVQ